MMDYMREGGVMMWVMLIGAIATVVLAVVWHRGRLRALLAGSVVQLGLGLLGMAMGLAAVSSGFARFPDQIGALGAGLGEVSNNGTFAALLAALLAVVAGAAHVLTKPRG